MAKQRALLENWSNFETSVQMCQRALDKTKVKDYKRLLESLDSSWFRFNADFKLYKDEVINKTAKTDASFNAVVKNDRGEDVPAFEYNDQWKNKEFNKYADMRENIQDKLDEIEAASAADVKQNATQVLTKGVEQSIVEIKNEISSIDSAVNSLHTEIHGYEDNKMNAATVVEHKANIARQFKIINEDLKLLIQAKLALPQESTDAEYSDQMIRDKYAAMSLKWKNKLNNLYMVLARKALNSEVIEPKLAVSHVDMDTSLETLVQKCELVHLDKIKPPRFNGTELEFPEFRRKWLAQVNKASLPEESELDKLREAVPRQAKDMLYGVTSLTEAWKILTHRYGNPDLISKKLKDQLKNVVCEGSNDPEKLMDLRIKVKNVVTRLETMELSAD